MRPREEDGVDYIFVSKMQFEAWIKEGKLLEHALVYGEYKGILRSQITHALDNKQDVVLRLDVQGAATMRRLIPDAISIFLVSLDKLYCMISWYPIFQIVHLDTQQDPYCSQQLMLCTL